MGDQNAERKADSGSMVVVSERNKDPGWNLARDRSCYIHAKNLTSFCLCSENLYEADMKSNGTICLTEEISR